MKHHSRGATMIEMSLVMVTLLFLTLGFVDILRFFGVRAALVRGAQNGMVLAQQIAGFEQDVREDTAPPGNCPAAVTDPPMTRVRCARQAIITEATRVPLSFLVDPPGTPGSASVLTGFQNFAFYNYVAGSPGTWSSWNEGTNELAAVLRPGELACDAGQSGAGGCAGASPKYVCHPTLLPPDARCPDPLMNPVPPVLAGTQGWNAVLAQNPLLVVLRARLNPIINWPILGSNWMVTGSATGFREIPRDYKVPPDMNLNVPPLRPTPQNIPTPNPTPGSCMCCAGRDYYGYCVSGCRPCPCPAYDPCS